MMDLKQAQEIEAKCLLNLYPQIRFPMVVARGEGCRVWDTEGREYLDIISGGRAVTVLGHCHPKIVAAITRQAGELIHVANDFYSEPQLRLAEILAEYTGGRRSYFCNSGAEANEAALKLARKHAYLQPGDKKTEFVTTLNSFHGRTFGALSATGQEKFHQGFQPLVPGFNYVPFNDLAALAAAVNERTCAVMLEPILGESGVHPAEIAYLQGAEEICRQAGALLILDEIQTGMGRTGKFLACEHAEINPDIVTLSKGLAGGVPIGAMLAREPAASSFAPSDHGTTFGGSPLTAAAAVAALTALKEEGLIEKAAQMGEFFLAQLRALQEKQPLIKEVRGQGLMIGVDLSQPVAPAVKAAARAKGLLLNTSGPNTLRMLPALVITRAQIDTAIAMLASALEEIA
jgi:acetylornithine/N-succinyldiaminopimelate aminotransferase